MVMSPMPRFMAHPLHLLYLEVSLWLCIGLTLLQYASNVSTLTDFRVFVYANPLTAVKFPEISRFSTQVTNGIFHSITNLPLEVIIRVIIRLLNRMTETITIKVAVS